MRCQNNQNYSLDNYPDCLQQMCHMWWHIPKNSKKVIQNFFSLFFGIIPHFPKISLRFLINLQISAQNSPHLQDNGRKSREFLPYGRLCVRLDGTQKLSKEVQILMSTRARKNLSEIGRISIEKVTKKSLAPLSQNYRPDAIFSILSADATSIFGIILRK